MQFLLYISKLVTNYERSGFFCLLNYTINNISLGSRAGTKLGKRSERRDKGINPLEEAARE